MIVPDLAGPGGERVKLLDFGIAKLGSGNGQNEEVKTRTGQILGTAAYMSPEQFGGHRPLDGQSDVYSLACLMFRLLTGQQPFISDSGEMAVAAMHMFKQAAPVHSLVPEIAEWLDALIESMMRKEPEQRPTMAQVAAQLQEQLPAFAQSRKSLPGIASRVSGSHSVSFSGSQSASQSGPFAASLSGSAFLPPRDPLMSSLSGGFLTAPRTKTGTSGSMPGTLTSASGEAAAPRPGRRSLVVAVGAAVVLLVAGGGAFFYLRGHNSPPATTANLTPPVQQQQTPPPPTPTPTPTPTPAAVDKPLVADPVTSPHQSAENTPPEETTGTESRRERGGKAGRTSRSGKSARLDGKSRSRTANETQIIN